MQDVGIKEDTKLTREDLTLSWRELSVEFLGHCQSVGNCMFFPARVLSLVRRKAFLEVCPAFHGLSS
jgi:hypothetical protein